MLLDGTRGRGGENELRVAAATRARRARSPRRNRRFGRRSKVWRVVHLLRHGAIVSTCTLLRASRPRSVPQRRRRRRRPSPNRQLAPRLLHVRQAGDRAFRRNRPDARSPSRAARHSAIPPRSWHFGDLGRPPRGDISSRALARSPFAVCVANSTHGLSHMKRYARG